MFSNISVRCLFVFFLFPLGFFAPGLEATAAASAEKDSGDTCIDCHSSKELMVTNKKLYDYYQNWLLSAHANQGITCSDCHGGDPQAKSKNASHRLRSGTPTAAGSRINFRNIPETCAECHEQIMEGYKKSKHYKRLVSKKQETKGPNCVTCHGSVNAQVLAPQNVKQVCSQCHNKKTKNHPEITEEVTRLLGRILSADRYRRYVMKRGNAADIKHLVNDIDPKRAKLGQTWHTFDLEAVDKEAGAIIESMHEMRDKIFSRKRGKK